MSWYWAGYELAMYQLLVIKSFPKWTLMNFTYFSNARQLILLLISNSQQSKLNSAYTADFTELLRSELP